MIFSQFEKGYLHITSFKILTNNNSMYTLYTSILDWASGFSEDILKMVDDAADRCRSTDERPRIGIL